MTMKTNVLMMTAAAFISGGAAFAQTVDPAPVDPAPVTTPSKPSIDFLLALFGGDTAPTKEDIAKAISDAGYEPGRIYVDSDGEARVRFFVDGVQYRVRIEGDELRYKRSDDGLADTSDANGDDTSGTSDGNGDDTGSSDSNGSTSGGGNSGSGGSDD